jgi:hypothetical protein
MNLQVLPKKQQDLLEALADKSWIKDFYMAGGTALALQIGHRESIDFDFFTQKEFDHRFIISELEKLGEFEIFHEADQTVNGRLNGIRISFFYYKYKVLNDFLIYKNIKLASLFDIALMKLEAISGRGSRKDFIDLYFLLSHFNLEEIYNNYHKKYGTGRDNKYHLLKSLAYFEDAEREKIPNMLIEIDWEEIKKKILNEVKKLESKIL